MIIAKTQEESDLLCDQEISHILRIDKKVPTIIKNGISALVDNENEKIIVFPGKENVSHVKTKKYGDIVYFDNISDLIESKYNKACVSAYCSSVSTESNKKYNLRACRIETLLQSYLFHDKEVNDNGFKKIFADKEYETNKIRSIEPLNAYLIVVQRDNGLINGVRIIDSFKINTKN